MGSGFGRQWLASSGAGLTGTVCEWYREVAAPVGRGAAAHPPQPATAPAAATAPLLEGQHPGEGP